MSDLSLGALSMQLKIDLGGLEASVRQAVGGLGRIESAADQTAKKTEDVGKVLKDSLKGEVFVNALNRIASSVGQLGGDFKGLGVAVQGAGAIMQGLFQGGPFGAAIAAAGVGVSALVSYWGEAEKAAQAAEKAQHDAMAAHVERMKALTSGMDKATADLAGSLRAIREGTDVESAVRANKMDALGSREFGLQETIRSKQSQVSSAQSRLAGPEGTFAFGAKQLNETIAQLKADLSGLEQAASEVAVEYSAVAAEAVAAEKTAEANRKATATATKELSAFAKAMKEARGWTPDKAGLEISAGEAARASAKALARMSLGAMANPDGSIVSEARDRAARNAGYRANASSTLMLDEPKKGGVSFAEQATAVTDSILAASFEFAESINQALGALGDTLKSVAPKTGAVINAAMEGFKSGGAWGAALGAISAALANSKVFQRIGNMLDKTLQSVVDSLTKFLEPLLPVVSVVLKIAEMLAMWAGSFISFINGISGVDAALWLLFQGLKLFGAVVSVVAATLGWIGTAIKNVIIDAAIGILALAGDATAGLRTTLATWKTEQAGFLETVGGAWDKIWKLDFSAEQATAGIDDLGAAADKVAQSFLNLPAGFKTSQALYNATSATSAPFGGFMPPPTAAALPAVAAGAGGAAGSSSGDVFNFYGPINVYGDGEFQNLVTVSAQQSGMASTGTTGGRQTYRSSPTPHAPNGIQPYTPATP